MILWGQNTIHLMGGAGRENQRAALLGGAKLLVVDPKKIDIAGRADVWLRPRPGSDGVVALGIIKVLIEQKLYDADFVEKWTVGFEELREHVKTFSFEDVERVSWVSREEIEKAAHLLATHKPACLMVGNGVERSLHAFQQIRAIFILRAILGQINVPGGNVVLKPAPFTRLGDFFKLKGSVRREKIKEKRAIGRDHRLAMNGGFVPPQVFINAILEEKPYPVKAALCMMTNPVISYPDSQKTVEAFKKLDFIVVADIFPSPTTALADIVLPAAWAGEHDSVGYWPGWFEEIRAYPKFIEPPGEARSDINWINDLARRLGLEHFWKNEDESFELMLKPSGLSWEGLKKKRSLHATKEYRDVASGIFKTPSGKVEIVSELVTKLGDSPMPLFEDLSTFRFEVSEEYPLLLFNAKEAAFMLTGYKHVNFLRRLRPQPTVDLHPQIAEELGLKEGDWVYIETKKGRIKQILSLDPCLDPRTVNVSFGWWFPEEEKEMFQFRKSNLNILTESEGPYDLLTGSVELGGIPCRLYKCE